MQEMAFSFSIEARHRFPQPSLQALFFYLRFGHAELQVLLRAHFVLFMDKVPYPEDVEAGVSKLELQPFDFRDEMRGFPILVST